MRYVFGDYTVDVQRRALYCRERAVPLRPQVFDLLVYLVTHHDRAVSKQELHMQLWPGLHVSEATLSACIKRVRQAVGDSGAAQRIIQTLHGRGYRFVAPVEVRDEASPAALHAERHPHAVEATPSSPLAGAPVAGAEAAGPAVPYTAGEYKPASVLCGALADASTLVAALDPEGLYRLLQTVGAMVQAVMQQYAGTFISQASGEGFTAVFGAPVAQEDHARRAVLAALDVQERLCQPPGGRGLALRMGIHSGLVVVGGPGAASHRLGTVVGAPMQGAMRLQQQAAPGTLLVSAATYHLVQEEVRGEPCGSLTLDGWQEPLAVYRVQGLVRRQAGVPQRALRSRSPFVGRQRELALLHDRLAAVQAGEGQVVSLVGAPGTGKTRLLTEFGRSVSPHQVAWYSGQCLAYGQVMPYLPVREFLQQVCPIAEGDAMAARTAAVRHRLAALGGVAEEDVAVMLHLLDLPVPPDLLAQLSPEARHTRTFALLWQLLRHEAQRQPLILAVENVHWIDATSAAWLAFLVERLASTAVLLLVTVRPEAPLPWGAHTAVTQLVLPPLRAAESQAVVQGVPGTAHLPAAMQAQIVARGAGNPFFLEELARYAVEHGGATTPVRVPETVHAVLAARIDRLTPAAKHLLQVAAVLGMQMTEPLLQAVLGWADVELYTCLQQLQTAELLYETRMVPVRTYTFKHALTQEVAYQSLLTHARQQYHQHIAQVLTERFPDRAAIQPELVAQHYTAAGLPAAALPYWQRAGQQAHQRSANLEAVQHLTKALELLHKLPETPARHQQELDLQLALGPALIATKGTAAPEVAQTYARARVLCAQVGDTPRLFSTLRGLCRLYRNQGAFATARELGEELVRLAECETAPTPRLEAYEVHGTTLFYLGEYSSALTHFAQGIALTDPAMQRALALRHGVAPGMLCLALAALALWCLGYPTQAVRRCQEALSLAQELAHPYSLAFAQNFAASLHYRRRDVLAVQAQAEALLTLATAQGFPHLVGYGACWRGWVLTMQGQGAAGLAQIQQGLAAIEATGQVLSRPRCLGLLAEAAGHVGQVEEGLRLMGEALTAFKAHGHGDLLAEAYRLQGELLLAQEGKRRQAKGKGQKLEAAAACFQQALTVARHQRAKSWELRAALSLARLWQRQGKRQAAADLLAPIYGWFTDGFDTADLQEAKALLAALARHGRDVKDSSRNRSVKGVRFVRTTDHRGQAPHEALRQRHRRA
jgi:class 3 adenylate cyclase/predicted ATPase